MQLSGNKVQKLEFLMADAVAKGADCIITIGGIQSNHCRATAVADKFMHSVSVMTLTTSTTLFKGYLMDLKQALIRTILLTFKIGKAAYGLLKDMAENPKKWEAGKILFIHTGGLLWLFDKVGEMAPLLGNWIENLFHENVLVYFLDNQGKKDCSALMNDAYESLTLIKSDSKNSRKGYALFCKGKILIACRFQWVLGLGYFENIIVGRVLMA